MSEAELTAAAISALANIILAGSAVAAAIAAFVGLRAWKEQGIWQADSELARRALITIFRFRDSLYLVRHPAMAENEMQLDAENQERLDHGERRRQGIIAAYARRWERHSHVRNELDALLIKADAVWDSSLSRLTKPLKALEHELIVYIKLHLDANFRGDTALAKSYREILNAHRNVLYDRLDEEDEFRRDFMRALEPVEAYLRKKLGRHR